MEEVESLAKRLIQIKTNVNHLHQCFCYQFMYLISFLLSDAVNYLHSLFFVIEIIICHKL